MRIEDSPVQIEPEDVELEFRRVVVNFSPTIYKEMARLNCFYELESACIDAAYNTGWVAE